MEEVFAENCRAVDEVVETKSAVADAAVVADDVGVAVGVGLDWVWGVQHYP